MFNMPIAQAFGNERLNGLVNQLIATIAKQLLGLAVELDDQPTLVNDKDRVGGIFEKLVG